MIERYGEVDQGLQKQAVRAAHGGPQFFQHFMTREELARAV
jgi:hypothetical protein